MFYIIVGSVSFGALTCVGLWFLRVFCDEAGVLSASATLAPGYRYHTSGELVSGGRSGYSWSSAASGSNGMDLDFGAAWLNPHGAPYRTYGFQLRCLSE